MPTVACRTLSPSERAFGPPTAALLTRTRYPALMRYIASLLFFIAVALPGVVRAENPKTAALMAPLRVFAHAFNTQNRTFTTTAFTGDCTTIDEFAPFGWQGRGSIRVWYSDTTGGADATSYRAFVNSDEVVTLDRPAYVRMFGNNAYVVVPSRLLYTSRGKRRLQHMTWTVSEVRTTAGWRIRAQAWAVLDDTVVGG